MDRPLFLRVHDETASHAGTRAEIRLSPRAGQEPRAVETVKHTVIAARVAKDGESYCLCSCGAEFYRSFGQYAAMEDYLNHKEVFANDDGEL